MYFSVYLRFISVFSLITSSLASLPNYATDWASLGCPQDSESTLPTPTYGDTDAVFTVCTEELIHAPLGRRRPFPAVVPCL
jgi:hypothetical protein